MSVVTANGGRAAPRSLITQRPPIKAKQYPAEHFEGHMKQTLGSCPGLLKPAASVTYD